MKNKRLIIPGALAGLAVLGIAFIAPSIRYRSERQKTVETLQSLPLDRLQTATQSFIRGRKARGTALRTTVSLRELVSVGYLRAADVRGLEGKEVIVSLTNDETTPQLILIRVRMSDGSEIALMSDGSIQGLPRR